MTVGTHDFTFLDLRKNRSPGPVPYAPRNGETLVSQVIEIQHEDVVFTTVRARMPTEMLHDIGHALHDELSGPLGGLIDIALAIVDVVLTPVFGPARRAVGVSLDSPIAELMFRVFR